MLSINNKKYCAPGGGPGAACLLRTDTAKPPHTSHQECSTTAQVSGRAQSLSRPNCPLQIMAHSIAGDNCVKGLDELPLTALSLIVSHMGPRPDSFLRSCKATWQVHEDMSTWGQWMMRVYGSEALHKLRHCRWLNTNEEQRVMAAVALLLCSGADPNLNEDKTGFWTPCALHWAVTQNFPRVVSLLVQGGSLVDENVICAAAAQGNVAMLEALVNSIKKEEFVKYRDFAFLQSASGGEVASAAWLLDHGADVNVNEGQALFEASYHGHLGVVRLLLDRGIEVRARNDGALIAAAFKGHLEVGQVLIAKGADVNSQGGRALVQAAGCGHLELCKMLLSYGAPEATLHEALVCACRKGFAGIVACLIENGARPGALDGAALTFAAGNNHPAVVRLLIKAGMDAQAVLDAETVNQMIRDGRFECLAAMEDEAAKLGRNLGPSAWGVELDTFCSFDALALERARLVKLMRGACSLSVVSAKSSVRN